MVSTAKNTIIDQKPSMTAAALNSLARPGL